MADNKSRRHYSFELKLSVVQRVLAGESKVDIAREYGLSSGRIVEPWVRKYRRDGEEALRPKRPASRPGSSNFDPGEARELGRLRDENERLRTQVAYLGKLRALREQGRR